MAGPSTLTRRASEFLGVALFAAAVLWIVALVTYEPSDPAWFVTTGTSHAAANFAGMVGAFVAEESFHVVRPVESIGVVMRPPPWRAKLTAPEQS